MRSVPLAGAVAQQMTVGHWRSSYCHGWAAEEPWAVGAAQLGAARSRAPLRAPPWQGLPVAATLHACPQRPPPFPVASALVLLLGWCWGERLRDGERGWFPQSCARAITNRTAVECNVRRMERLRIETDV